MDLLIRQFEQKLIEDINTTKLPIEVKRLVVAEVMKKVEAEADRIVGLEQQESMQSKEENSDGIQ